MLVLAGFADYSRLGKTCRQRAHWNTIPNACTWVCLSLPSYSWSYRKTHGKSCSLVFSLTRSRLILALEFYGLLPFFIRQGACVWFAFYYSTWYALSNPLTLGRGFGRDALQTRRNWVIEPAANLLMRSANSPLDNGAGLRAHLRRRYLISTELEFYCDDFGLVRRQGASKKVDW